MGDKLVNVTSRFKCSHVEHSPEAIGCTGTTRLQATDGLNVVAWAFVQYCGCVLRLLVAVQMKRNPLARLPFGDVFAYGDDGT